MIIKANYCYLGSVQHSVGFIEGDNPGEIKITTSYGKIIAIVKDVLELQKVLRDIQKDIYA